MFHFYILRGTSLLKIRLPDTFSCCIFFLALSFLFVLFFLNEKVVTPCLWNREKIVLGSSKLYLFLDLSEVKLLSRVRFCDLMNCSQPVSSIHWIFQARILEWVAISFSRGNRTWVSSNAGSLFTV